MVHRAYVYLSLIIAGCCSVALIVPKIEGIGYEIPRSYDPESSLAMTGKINIRDLTPYELMLIPGFSDSLALRVYSVKNQLVLAIGNDKREIQKEILKSVHGIGDKTAEKLLRLIELDK